MSDSESLAGELSTRGRSCPLIVGVLEDGGFISYTFCRFVFKASIDLDRRFTGADRAQKICPNTDL